VRKSFLALAAIVFISHLFLEGCVPAKPVQIERTIAPDRLVKRLEANRRKIKNFSGSGQISIKTKEMDTKSSFLVEIKKPDSIKVAFYGPFGIDLAYALITRNNFLFYDAINNTVYKGKMRAGIMKDILKVDIAFDDLMDLASGSVNLSDKLMKEPDSFESTDDLLTLTYNDSLTSKSNSYFIQNDRLEIRNFQQNNMKGKNLLTTKFSGFRIIDEIPVPSEIVFDDYLNNQRIRIEYKKIEINNGIGDLKLEIPSDAKIIEW